MSEDQTQQNWQGSVPPPPPSSVSNLSVTEMMNQLDLEINDGVQYTPPPPPPAVGKREAAAQLPPPPPGMEYVWVDGTYRLAYLPPTEKEVAVEAVQDIASSTVDKYDPLLQQRLTSISAGNQQLTGIAALIKNRINDLDEIEASKPVRPPKTDKPPRPPKAKKDTSSDENTQQFDDNGDPLPPSQRQPTRSKRTVDPNRLYDGTSLHADHHGYFVHRDYAAHFFRWGWVARRVKRGMRILDIGCGVDLPLERVISAPNVYMNAQPEMIVAVDWNKVPRHFNPAWLLLKDDFDFNSRFAELITSTSPEGEVRFIPSSQFDLIVCLEVIEHMPVEKGDELLRGIYACLKPGGCAILSTPVFDGKAAANHIHEYGIAELAQKFITNGFTITERYGTFASEKDIKKVATDAEKALIQELKMWHSGDVIANFLAPKYPDASRNNCWVIMRTKDVQAIQNGTPVAELEI